MGYNPFKPHMSFSGAGPTNISSSSTIPTSSSSNTNKSSIGKDQLSSPTPVIIPPIDPAEEDVMSDAINEAFALLMSGMSTGNNGEEQEEKEQEERVNTAISTVMKMLKNAYQKPQDSKLRTVRMMNEAFQSRVLSVPGGLELMLSAGFSIQECPPEPGAGITDDMEHVLYLKHDSSERANIMLAYTLHRLSELQEESR
jgi:hypothetical protein